MDNNTIKTWLCRLLATSGICLLGGCGLPDAPDVKAEFERGIRPLGLIPFYPLLESPRIGQVYLVNEASKEGHPARVNGYPINRVFVEDLVPAMEERRAARVTANRRFQCSSEQLPTQLSVVDQKRAYYQQGGCPTAASSSTTGSTQAAAPSTTFSSNAASVNVTIRSSPAAQRQQTPAATTSGRTQPPRETLPAPLELAGFPSYQLASIQSAALSGAVPTAFANFLAAFSQRRDVSLKVEAEAVEVASLPYNDFADVVSGACTRPGNLFYDRSRASRRLAGAVAELSVDWRSRARAVPGLQLANPDFRVYMIRQVFYLRGIRYIFGDTRAYSALAEAAAARTRTSAAPTLPAVNVNVMQSGQTASTDQNSGAAQQLTAMQAQIDSLRTALTSTGNISVAATFSRVTARGIEFVDLFQRPMAFGYVPHAISYKPGQGLQEFCDDFN